MFRNDLNTHVTALAGINLRNSFFDNITYTFFDVRSHDSTKST